MQTDSLENSEVVELLRGGGIGVIKTDTLYGVVARADNEAAVERVYKLKSRDEAKSPIVLIANRAQLFDEIDENMAMILDDVWPAKISVIIPSLRSPQWLTRGNKSVAYRLPDDAKLQELLEKTGPLIAPSANPEGELPAMNIDEAKHYFGERVDFYVDSGEVLDSEPSKLLRVGNHGEIERLR